MVFTRYTIYKDYFSFHFHYFFNNFFLILIMMLLPKSLLQIHIHEQGAWLRCKTWERDKFKQVYVIFKQVYYI